MFYAIPNSVAMSAFALPEPWNFVSQPLPATVVDKTTHRQWCGELTTQHAFISAFEGLDPRSRVSYDAGNPPFKMHGLVIDYDAEVTQSHIDSRKLKIPSEFKPTHVSRTYSGNARVVWQFEKPVLLASKAQYKKFAIELNRHLKLSSWFAGFETASFSDAAHYYEIGTNWQPMFPDYRIPSNLLELWLYESGKDIPIVEDAPQYAIPFEALAAEAEARFPGRWKGPFEEGRRGIRFWDSTASDDTAAILRKDGALCFTGGKGFVSWREIFGGSFVEKFEADRIASIRQVTCYDGRSFWVLRSDRWVEVSKEDFGQTLRVQGFSSLRKGPSSETDRIENDIKLNRFVRSAMPFVHFPTGIIVHKGEQYLNYSTVKALQPAPPMTEGKMQLSDGRKYFPFLMDFFSNFFEPPTPKDDRLQLEYFYAWLKHFYTNALAETPRQGQIVVIAGPPGRGKTFLTRGIVANMVGGCEDAANFLVDGQVWTDTVCESPIMAIDDSLAAADPKAQLRFTALIKKIVANTAITYNGKFKKQGLLPWYGRVMITSNLDPESLKILPNMEISVLDKISLFKAANSKTKLPGEMEQRKLVAAELPYFCRWLLDWTVPDHLVSEDPRFGVNPYHHIDLHQASVQQGHSHTVFELLMDFIESEKEQHPEKDAWEGRCTSLYREMAILGESMMKRVTVHQLGTSLGMLVSRGLPITTRVAKGNTLWRIPYSLSGEDLSYVAGKKPAKQTFAVALPAKQMEEPVEV